MRSCQFFGIDHRDVKGLPTTGCSESEAHAMISPMAKGYGSLPRGRRRDEEVPPVPQVEAPAEVEVQGVLRSLVERAGGRFGRQAPVPVPDDLTVLVDYVEAWVRSLSVPREGELHFSGRPGLWLALDHLYPLQDPNRWDRLRADLLRSLADRGWHKTRPPRGPGLVHRD